MFSSIHVYDLAEIMFEKVTDVTRIYLIRNEDIHEDLDIHKIEELKKKWKHLT